MNALLQATALDRYTPPPATRKQAAAPPQDTRSATALPQESQPTFEALQVPPFPLSCPSCHDEQSAKCSRRICLKRHHTLQLYRESPKEACSHAEQG